MEERLIGLTFKDHKISVLRVWAPLADQVKLLLLRDNSVYDLKKEENGYWSKQFNHILPNHLYKIIIDGNAYPDPASIHQPQGVHEASQALNLTSFNWKDEVWEAPQLADMLIYELHTGTFSTEGNFNGIANKLDYLLDLGINTIELMPVAQFPGSRNWGYDGVYPFAVQNSYGGPVELQNLVNICHSKGIAVILDVVYNHLGPEGNYLPNFGPYFTNKYQTPWGRALNFDDEWCDGVRDYFIENTLMWFRDFHVDGLRLDAVHAIKDLSASHFLQQLRYKVNELKKNTGKNYHLIVECDLNDKRFLEPLDKNGFEMDCQWIDEFHHALRVSAGGEQNAYYQDFKPIEHLAKAFTDAYVYDGIYSPHRKRIFGNSTGNLAGSKFLVFSQNHDQVGNRMLGERSSILFSFEMQKLMAVTVFISPFVPMLFMGEEWGERNPFLFFTSHSDQDLIENVRKGRKAEFKDFQSDNEAPDPQEESTFFQSKLQWNLLDQEKHQTLFKFYKALISLKKSVPQLNNPDRSYTNVTHNCEEKTIIVYRGNADEKVICILNFSNQAKEVSINNHKKQLKKIFDSASGKWGGNVESAEIIGDKVMVNHQAALIYQTYE